MRSNNDADSEKIAQILVLTELHGGDLSQWPTAKRRWAEEFVAASPRARNAVLIAGRLDALLDQDVAPSPSAALRSRVLADATSVNDATIAPKRKPTSILKTIKHLVRALGGWGPTGALAGGFGVAAAAGLALGVFTSDALDIHEAATTRGDLFSFVAAFEDDDAI